MFLNKENSADQSAHIVAIFLDKMMKKERSSHISFSQDSQVENFHVIKKKKLSCYPDLKTIQYIFVSFTYSMFFVLLQQSLKSLLSLPRRLQPVFQSSLFFLSKKILCYPSKMLKFAFSFQNDIINSVHSFQPLILIL